MVEAATDPRLAAVELIAGDQRRKLEEASDERIAARLGISRSMWSLLRSGKRRPGLHVMRKMMVAFPETRPLLLSFFLADANEVGHGVHDSLDRAAHKE